MGGKRHSRRRSDARSAARSQKLAIFVVVVATATAAHAEGDKPVPTRAASEEVDPVCPKGDQGAASVEKQDGALIVTGDCTDVDFAWFNADNIRVNGQVKLKEDSPEKIQLLQGGVRVYRFESGEKSVEIYTHGEASAIVLTKGTATVVMLDKDTIAVRADEGDAVVKQEGRDEDVLIPAGQQRKLSLKAPSAESVGCVVSFRDGQSPKSNSRGQNTVVLTSGLIFIWFTRRRKTTK